jgi:hypothetical protein
VFLVASPTPTIGDLRGDYKWGGTDKGGFSDQALISDEGRRPVDLMGLTLHKAGIGENVAMFKDGWVKPNAGRLTIAVNFEPNDLEKAVTAVGVGAGVIDLLAHQGEDALGTILGAIKRNIPGFIDRLEGVLAAAAFWIGVGIVLADVIASVAVGVLGALAG